MLHKLAASRRFHWDPRWDTSALSVYACLAAQVFQQSSLALSMLLITFSAHQVSQWEVDSESMDKVRLDRVYQDHGIVWLDCILL